MIPLRLADIATLTGGRLEGGSDPETRVSGPVLIDSRQASPGSLFVALPGEHADGHDFALAAVRAGASAVLAARPVGAAAVLVEDVQVALGRLAAGVLSRLPDLPVVAVTGSTGKTSTKDLLAQVLGRVGATVAPPGSYNTEVGLPLTVLRADAATRYLVLEMGARGPGHIAYLAALARPRIGVVLNVGSAHLGEFGTREAVAQTKGELVEALPDAASGGVAVLNADDPMVAAMSSRTHARVTTFARTAAADVRASDVRLDERGRAAFTLASAHGSAPVALQLVGAHQVSNALACAAVALELGMPLDDIAVGLGAAVALSRWRMEVSDTDDGVTVLNDAYNANPESMRAALEALVAVGGARRTWAVLGEMRELGEESAREHAGIGVLAARLGVARLVAVGEGTRPLLVGDDGNGEGSAVWVADVPAALELLRRQLRTGDVVLVKASRAAGLEVLAAELLAPRTAGASRDRP